MHNLGRSRASQQHNHLLQTPDTFIRAPLPGMQRATAIVHAAPALGAGFTQYTAELQPEGCLGPTAAQRFIYVLEGSVSIDDTQLSRGGYAYLPAPALHAVIARAASRIAVIDKPYEELEGINAPAFFTGNEDAVDRQPVMGDPAVEVRTLLPDKLEYDFAVNIMAFQPGAALSIVEMHVMEHGLLMLEGGGIYRLGDCWYPVSAGDFIWMAPFCPQWFGALGKVPARYLLYKDWNR